MAYTIEVKADGKGFEEIFIKQHHRDDLERATVGIGP
jgi:hypothetical protein